METSSAWQRWKRLWLWQREKGENPQWGCLFSSSFFFFTQLSCFNGKEDEGKSKGEECELSRPSGVQVFFTNQTGPVWSSAVWGVKSVSQQGVEWQKQTHVVNAVQLMVCDCWTAGLWEQPVRLSGICSCCLLWKYSEILPPALWYLVDVKKMQMC